MLAYWSLKPRGEERQDLRQILSQLVLGKDGVKQYFAVLGMDEGKGEGEETMKKFAKETKGMSANEKVEWIAANTEPDLSGLTDEQREQYRKMQTLN